MAGGRNAETVPCQVCLADHGVLTAAVRVYEGDETDHYRCEKGHEFGIDWSAGEAEEPMWPPSAELKTYVKEQAQGA